MSTESRRAWGAGLAGAALLVVLEATLEVAALLPRSVADVLGLARLGWLVGAPLVLHPLAFAAGARPLLRAVVPLLPFAAWTAGQVLLRAQQGHTAAESLYLAASPPVYLLAQLLALEMAAAELVARALGRARRGRAPGPRVLPRGVVLVTGAVAAWVLSDLLVVEGLFPGYQQGYAALFQAGELPRPDEHPGPLPAQTRPAPGEDRLPNVVVILSDDHRADFAGHAGHPFVRTPSLDRLAAEGMRFERAFVTSSLCSPSRASFLTGQVPERHGVLNNFSPWSPRSRTFFEYLSRAGYRTAFIGKWHMPGGLPDLRGVDHFVSFTTYGGQGRYHDTPLVVDGRPEPSRATYIAEELTDRALAWVERHRVEHPDRPFALYLSHKNVHAPFTPAEPERGRYADAPLDVRTPYAWAHLDDAQYVHLMLRPLPALVRRYAEAVATLDREIGRVLDALDRQGLADDTLVVYTSDNGYLWGEHGHVDKRWAWEESIRVPWLVRWPGVVPEGTRSRRLVLNLDLAPTLMELAGFAVPAHVQGRSLLPLLRDPEASWRDAFVYRYFFEAPYPVPTQRAVRTDRYKYLEWEGRPPALFDLVRDPAERRNLAGTPDAGSVERRLRQRLREGDGAR